MQSQYLTVRGLPSELGRALETERRRRGCSLNQVVIDLLRDALGIRARRPTNGLEKLAGSWSEPELKSFERATEMFEQIDQELWK